MRVGSWTQGVGVGEAKCLGEEVIRKFRNHKLAHKSFGFILVIIRVSMKIRNNATRELNTVCNHTVANHENKIGKTGASERTSRGVTGVELKGKGTALSSVTDAFEFPAASKTENSDWFIDNRKLSGKFDEC